MYIEFYGIPNNAAVWETGQFWEELNQAIRVLIPKCKKIKNGKLQRKCTFQENVANENGGRLIQSNGQNLLRKNNGCSKHKNTSIYLS